MESFSAPTANDECEGWWDNGGADDSDAESLNSDVTDDDVSFTFIPHLASLVYSCFFIIRFRSCTSQSIFRC